jgi:hypothetical protein
MMLQIRLKRILERMKQVLFFLSSTLTANSMLLCQVILHAQKDVASRSVMRSTIVHRRGTENDGNEYIFFILFFKFIYSTINYLQRTNQHHYRNQSTTMDDNAMHHDTRPSVSVNAYTGRTSDDGNNNHTGHRMATIRWGMRGTTS